MEVSMNLEIEMNPRPSHESEDFISFANISMTGSMH